MTSHTSLAWMLLAGLGLWAGGLVVAQEPFDELSCTSFPAELTEGDLTTRYGNANVKRAPVTGSDDGPQDGTVIFDATPRRLDIVWRDQEARSRPAWVRAREPMGRWRTVTGISIGMDLRSIERLNGRPFRLRGLTAPEGLGVIQSWGSGRLPNADGDGCAVRISLQPIKDQAIDHTLYRQVSRGSNFSSGHPAMQAINPRVTSLWVVHDPISRRADP
jgi:hypothetical protein